MMDHVYKVARPQDFQQWAETEDSGAEGDGESSDEEKSISPDAYIRMGRGLKEKDKIAIVKMAIDVEQGKGGPDADF